MPPPKFPASLEDTISVYKNKFLIDLDDENDDAPLFESITEKVPDDSSHSSHQQKAAQNLRVEYDPDDSDSMDKGRRQKSKLPRDLAGLMGQANVSFARGEYNDAILMCQEVIRLAPKCAEPFISLAEHYQELEDEEKAEQLYLIAAYLQPSNTHLWVRVADSATKRREFRLAASCYTKAIRAEKNESCVLYHLRRCNLYEKLGDQKKALRGYENLVSALGSNDKDFGLELSRGIARIYQAEDKIEACIRTLESAFEKYSSQLSAEDLGQLCYCYNLTEQYTQTIDVMVEHCQVTVKLGGANEEVWNSAKMKALLQEDNQHLPPPIQVLLDTKNHRLNFSNRCYLAVAFISIGYSDDTISPILNELSPSQSHSDRLSWYSVAKAYFSQGAYEKAKQTLLQLTTYRDSQSAPIWLLYSRCLKNLEQIDEAIDAYRKVLTYEPDDYSSRLALSNLLSVQGRCEEALEVTRQPLFSEKPIDIPLLYQSCQLLEEAELWDEYCETAKALLLTDMIFTTQAKEITSMITSKSFRSRLDNLRAVHKDLSLQDSCTIRQKYLGSKLDSVTMLKTFLRYVQILFHVQKDYQQLKRICFSAYTCSAFECYESSIDFYSTVACVISKDKEFTYNHLKILASRNSDLNQVWNLLGMSMSNIYKDLRHGRFCLRQFLKNPDILPLAIFNGHNALMSGSYKHALGEYMSVFRTNPNNPFVAFCIALTFLSLSCQRYVSSKYLCLFQMIAFMHAYLEMRGTCQESMYNIGRFFHQMNMLDKAVIFYKKALSMRDTTNISRLSESDEQFKDIFDVRREAAFNLALIYKNSQSYRLAYQVIKDNFTV